MKTKLTEDEMIEAWREAKKYIDHMLTAAIYSLDPKAMLSDRIIAMFEWLFEMDERYGD